MKSPPRPGGASFLCSVALCRPSRSAARFSRFTRRSQLGARAAPHMEAARARTGVTQVKGSGSRSVLRSLRARSLSARGACAVPARMDRRSGRTCCWTEK
ncbi:hypothetical protein AOLI_G00010400 [Acnodon oligacanthus]